MKDLLQELWMKNCSINIKFLENKTVETTSRTNLISIPEIKKYLDNWVWCCTYDLGLI